MGIPMETIHDKTMCFAPKSNKNNQQLTHQL